MRARASAGALELVAQPLFGRLARLTHPQVAPAAGETAQAGAHLVRLHLFPRHHAVTAHGFMVSELSSIGPESVRDDGARHQLPLPSPGPLSAPVGLVPSAIWPATSDSEAAFGASRVEAAGRVTHWPIACRAVR